MKTTQRFERAVTKLYNAFHEGKLNAFKCSACAVGNIVGHGGWKMICAEKAIEGIKEKVYFFNPPKSEDYSTDELMHIEFLFMSQFKSGIGTNKEEQFKGLCAVVEYLCELDGIPNVMDYSSLFDYDEQGAKKELKEVF